ncbi:hypothetical protein QYF36_000674 [Acer negundo]|nr:hypothetical protein QYF36_000674 [Acer negundo]
MEAVKDTQATLETRGSKASQRAEVMNWDGTYSWLDYTRLQARPSKPHRHVHKNPPEICLLKANKTKLQLGYKKHAVIMIVGVSGAGKTTSLGKLAYRLKNEGTKVTHLKLLRVTN